LYAIDVATGAAELVSRAPDGSPANLGGGGFGRFDASRDGDFVAYATPSTNVLPQPGTPGGIVMIQRSTGITRQVSMPSGLGTIMPSVSSNGRRVAFLDFSGYFSNQLLRVYDWETGSRRWLEQTLSGLPDGRICGTDLIFNVAPVDTWQLIALSGDGRTVYFPSLASNLIAGDEPNTCDLFFRPLGAVPQPPVAVDTVGRRSGLLWALSMLVVLAGMLAIARRMGDVQSP
jgi:hypothetical protein